MPRTKAKRFHGRDHHDGPDRLADSWPTLAQSGRGRRLPVHPERREAHPRRPRAPDRPRRRQLRSREGRDRRHPWSEWIGEDDAARDRRVRCCRRRAERCISMASRRRGCARRIARQIQAEESRVRLPRSPARGRTDVRVRTCSSRACRMVCAKKTTSAPEHATRALRPRRGGGRQGAQPLWRRTSARGARTGADERSLVARPRRADRSPRRRTRPFDHRRTWPASRGTAELCLIATHDPQARD